MLRPWLDPESEASRRTVAVDIPLSLAHEAAALELLARYHTPNIVRR